MQSRRFSPAGTAASGQGDGKGFTSRLGPAGLALLSVVMLFGSCMSPNTGGNTTEPPAESPAKTPAESRAESTGAPEEAVAMESGRFDFRGVWDGALTVGGTQIDITVKFLLDPAGPTAENAGPGEPPVAVMDIPAQLAFGLPLSGVLAAGRTAGAEVHFELRTSGPTLIADGELALDGSDDPPRINGTFSQGPASGEFVLRRVADLGPAATQPEPASSGAETAVSIENGGVVVRGTLLEPDRLAGEAAVQMPLAIIVAGSGPTDRDGNSALIPGRNDSLKLLAEGLARSGIASLRYDKRGIGASAFEGMREEDLVFGDLVNDLLAWTLWSGSREDVSAVYLIGHSEGGLVALTAAGIAELGGDTAGIDVEAARRAREIIDRVVCIATPGRTLDEVTLDQLEQQLGSQSPLYERSREILDAIRSGSTVPDVPPELAALFRSSVQPYLQSVFQHDPVALAAAVPQRMLVVAGVEDLQVPVSDAEALANARPDARLVVIEGMNHVLKLVPPADLAANQRAYADPSFELAPRLVDAVSGFVLEK